ncbi:MAG: hypothetical protein AAEJ57_08275 [Opitutales bacterium]
MMEVFDDVSRSCERHLTSRGLPCEIRLLRGGVSLRPKKDIGTSDLAILSGLPIKELDLANMKVVEVVS